MWNLNRMRKSAGNICLVLFIAFLFSITVAPFTMIGSAEASYPTVTVVEKNSNGQWVEGNDKTIQVNNNGYYHLLIDLAVNPLSPINFNELRIDFDNGGGKVVSVYANNTPDSVYYNTYSKVYSIVYDAPSDFKNPVYNVVYGKVYVGSTSLYSVILTLNPQPPSTPSTPDPVIPKVETKTTTTDTGVVTQIGDAATVAVDTTKLTDLINSDKPVIIEVPVNTVASTIKVEMTASLFNASADKQKEITIKTDDVQFVIPPAAFKVKALDDMIKADPTTKVTLNVKEVTPASISLADKMGTPANANLKAVGKVFDFELMAKSSTSESRISEFGKKLRVAIPYTDGDITGIKEDSLGAYRVTATGLQFLGGDVDKAKNQVWFETGSFSNYTLMAKLAAFGDIMGHWAKTDIELLAEKGIVKGVSENSFAPAATITRAEFAALLVRALNLTDAKPATATFKDIKSTAWYYGAVEAAAAKGLVTGYNGNFNPAGKITRQEMAVMIARALKVGGKNVTLTSSETAQQLSKFSDKQQIAGWAQDSVAIAVKEKVVNGRTANTFVASANANRAEGTVMIKRVLEGLGKL